MREIPTIVEGLKLLLETYSLEVLGKLLPSYDFDKDMQQDYQENGQVEQNDDEDWGLDNEGDDDMDLGYQEQIAEVMMKDQINEMRQLGVKDLSQSQLLSTVVNYKSLRLFEKTKFYQEALEAQEYLKTYENRIKGWLNIVVVKEFLNVRVEIDLNYIDLHPNNINLLGWRIEEPLIIVLDVSESTLLNSDEQELGSMSFAKMQSQNMLQYQSFGCNEYIRKIFIKFIEESLQKNIDVEEEEKLSFGKLQNKPQKSIWSKLFGTKLDDENLAHLVNMGFDAEISCKNLKKANNDIEKAIDLIKEEQLNGNLVEIDDNGGKNLLSKFVPHTKNQLIRMMLFISDQLEQATRSCLLCHSSLLADSIKLRTCNSEHCEFTFEENFGGSILSELKCNTNEASLDISLAAKALFSQRAGKVFEPFPTFFLKQNEIRGKRGNLDFIKQAQEIGQDVTKAKGINEQNKDLKSMIDIFSKIPTTYNLIKDVGNETELREKLNSLYQDERDGRKAYKLLTYIFATNRSTIRKLKQEEIVDMNQGGAVQNVDFNQYFDQYILISQDPIKDRTFMERKKLHGSQFCWHGSSQENWYSIMRNGLRNLSNTQLMTAGAAYGVGIYASSQFATSYGYAARYNGSGRSWLHMGAGLTQSFMIAICEIIKKPGYNKGVDLNIVVVPDEDDIIIRYLFVIKNGAVYSNQIDSTKINFEKHYYNQLKKVNQQLVNERKLRIEDAYNKYQERKSQQQQEMKKIQEQTQQKLLQAEEEELENQFKQMAEKFTGQGSAISSQRIFKDYSGLIKSSEFKDKIKIDFFKDNKYIWKVNFDITNYEVSKELKRDFVELQKKLGQKDSMKLQYEVIFSDQYPYAPPFVRVVFPRFAFRTGHVTVGGSICIESLTPSGWNPARSLESYFVEIISLINAGDARLDLDNLQPYLLQQAKEAFNRVAREHGWTK